MDSARAPLERGSLALLPCSWATFSPPSDSHMNEDPCSLSGFESRSHDLLGQLPGLLASYLYMSTPHTPLASWVSSPL